LITGNKFVITFILLYVSDDDVNSLGEIMKYLFVILMLGVIGCGGDEWTKKDGLLWSDVATERMNYYEAIDYCKDMGGAYSNN